ncbi:hypothetical protein V1478_017387 [Vespula squamosa]|uniref:Uncharacterized protein n=1 Tax=Vespula squamosa TaxID=30214 RepID=A0ABD1ZXT8_VESSQ
MHLLTLNGSAILLTYHPNDLLRFRDRDECIESRYIFDDSWKKFQCQEVPVGWSENNSSFSRCKLKTGGIGEDTRKDETPSIVLSRGLTRRTIRKTRYVLVETSREG